MVSKRYRVESKGIEGRDQKIVMTIKQKKNTLLRFKKKVYRKKKEIKNLEWV